MTDYLFSRQIGSSKGRTMCFIGLAPLPGDAPNATVRRYGRWAAAWGYDGAIAVNLHPFVTTSKLDGLECWARMPDPSACAQNAEAVMTAVRTAERVVACWGSSRLGALSPLHGRLVSDKSIDLWCLGKTRAGHPVHPAARFLPSIPTLAQWSAR